MSDVSIDHLPQFKRLGKQLINSAEKAAGNGDIKAQEAMLMANWEIGDKLRLATGRAPALTELVGIALENATLRAWPAGVAFGDRPAADSLASNNNDRGTLNLAGPAFMKWAPTAPDHEVIKYADILKASGERQALTWLVNLHPELANAGRELSH